MTQSKTAHSGASVRELLRKAEKARKTYEARVGKIPSRHADLHETQFRNHLRMKTSAT